MSDSGNTNKKQPFSAAMQPQKKGLSEHAQKAMENMAKRLRKKKQDANTFYDDQLSLNGGNIIPSDLPPIWDDLWIDELLD